MDINCTHACFYQHNGKCNLRELPAYTQQNAYTSSSDIDCPYYSNKQYANYTNTSQEYPNIIA